MHCLSANGDLIKGGNIAQHGCVDTPTAMPNCFPSGCMILNMNQSSNYTDYQRWLDILDGEAGILTSIPRHSLS